MTESEFLEACDGRLPTNPFLRIRIESILPTAARQISVALRYLQAVELLDKNRVEVVHLWAGAGQVWADGLFVASPNGWLTPRGEWSQQATERDYFPDRFAATVAAIKAVKGERR